MAASLALAGLLILFGVPTQRASAVNGSALSFDGVNDVVVVADRNSFSPAVNNMTISFWAKVPTTATALGSGGCGNAGRYFVAKGAANDWEWGFENDNNTLLCFTLWQPSGSNYGAVSVQRTINDGLWHYYAVTIAYQARLILYLDGAQVASRTSFSNTMSNGAQPLLMGGRSDGNNFLGLLDEMRIETRELSANEIAFQYNSGAGRYGTPGTSLAAAWHFDEGTGTVASDYSGHGATGTLTNGPTWTTGLIPILSSDTTAPSGSVTINGAAAYTNTTAATLSLSATDNSGTVSQMQLSNNGTTYNPPEAYATTKSWTLATTDGTKTVYAKFSDPSGNWSVAATDTIILDTIPPSGSVTINSGAASTGSTSVTLALSATDALTPVAQMRFSNDGVTYSTAEPYAMTKTWTLSSGDGTKTVYAKFADAAGNWSSGVTATITLATTSSLSLTISTPANGALFGKP